MPIDRVQLAADQLLWLPDGNVISTAHMSSISESVITVVGDDEDNYAEVLCKSLKAIAQANLAKYVVDEQNLKKEKLDTLEIERFQNFSKNPWKEYIDKLSDICPIFGYTGIASSKPIGIVINNGTAISVDTCEEYDDTTIYL